MGQGYKQTTKITMGHSHVWIRMHWMCRRLGARHVPIMDRNPQSHCLYPRDKQVLQTMVDRQKKVAYPIRQVGEEEWATMSSPVR